jgi:hypothetical protein
MQKAFAGSAKALVLAPCARAYRAPSAEIEKMLKDEQS